ncbi:MAG: polysaccharide biosynthesis C-terminal domain-containing protein [Candidatus Rokubacteria bacterium]|nr:polysaccharide biosynthesis C-terminal domain-containing protein [Candidatus Rokubacteria bacterium]
MSGRRRAFAGAVGVTLAGQLCAVAYEIAVAGRFGTGVEADALALALTVVIAVANEIVGWVSTLFVPHYIEAQQKAGATAAGSFFRASLGLLAGGTVLLMVGLIVASSSLAGLLAPGAAVRQIGAGLLRLFAPLVVLLPLSVLLAGALQAHGRFVVASLRQLCWYGVALVAVVALGRRLGPPAVAMGMVGGLVLFGAILALAIAARQGVPRGGEPAGPRIRRVLTSLLPLALASGANYVNIMVERGLAARLPEGSLAALTYAFRLLNFPMNLFLLNAATMLLPPLALHAARNDTAQLEALLRRALRLALVFTVPLAALAIALAEPAISVLLQRGAFTADSTRLTATALACYAPGLCGMAGVHVLSRAYQALQEVRRMAWTGIAVIVLNIVLMSLLTAIFGFPGLPLAMSVSGVTLFAVMLLAIRPRLPGLGPGAVLASAGRTLVAGAVAAGCIAIVRGSVVAGAAPSLVAGAVVGTAAYALMLVALSRDDARLVLALVAPAWSRRAPGRS